ncbi:MAG: putative DCC family thiol-disulfide oxidoreductase YuxK, partial [Pseudohongiellaceae bacterium]
FAAGFRDRAAAAVLLLALGGNLPGSAVPPVDFFAGLLLVALLLCHVCQLPAPYLSFDARGRLDPAGSWSHRGWTTPVLALCLVVTALAFAWQQLSGSEPVAASSCWDMAVTLCVALPFVVSPDRFSPVRGGVQGDLHPGRVFYDGHCGLCHRAVRWILAEDQLQPHLGLAPLQGETFAALVDEGVRSELPESLVFRRDDGELLLKSQAVLAILQTLGGFWRALGLVLVLVPRPLRDLAYDGIARVRFALFGEAAAACPLLPAHLIDRFDH